MFLIGIYKITNKINGKCYIGQAVDIERRWKKHRTAPFNENDIGYDYPLYRAIRKYGLDNFLFEVVEECAQNDLNAKEIFYVSKFDSYHNGYNQNEGGNSNTHSYKLTQMDIDSIIQRLKTTIDSPFDIGKDFGVGGTTIKMINRGLVHKRENEIYPIRPKLWSLTQQQDDLYILKQTPRCQSCGREIWRGCTLCKECYDLSQRTVERPEPLELAKLIKEIGFSATGQKFGVSGNTIKKWCKIYQIPHKLKELISWYNEQVGIVELPKQKCKVYESTKVKQIDPATDKVINIFDSIRSAARTFPAGATTNISRACKGQRQTAYGYRWELA